jgi:SAM-dependent methyltransferase
MASHSAHAGAGIDWDARYVAGDTPWDKGGAHPALVARLKEIPLTGRVLVPGCGAGHDVRAIAAQGASSVLGLDVSPTALNLAHGFPRAGNECYQAGDFLTGNAVPAGSFDALFEHTCLCAIPPERRADYVKAAATALRDGGLLLAVFFTNPENPAPHSPPFRCDLAEMSSLFIKDFEMLETHTAIPTYSEREGRETLCLLRKNQTRNTPEMHAAGIAL